MNIGLILLACVNHNMAALKTLISKETVNVNLDLGLLLLGGTSRETTALIMACVADYVEGVKWMVEELGAHVTNKTAWQTLLSGRLSCLKYLIRQGADIHFLIDAVFIPEMKLPSADTKQCVYYLLERGARLYNYDLVPLWVLKYERELTYKRLACVSACTTFIYTAKKRGMPHDLAKHMAKQLLLPTWMDNSWGEQKTKKINSKCV